MEYDSIFSIYGEKNAKLGIILNLINPRCGGILILGDIGVGKSTLIKGTKRLGESFPFFELPLCATQEMVLGTIDIEKTIESGERVFSPGILQRVDGGFLIVDDISLLPKDLLYIILEAKEKGFVIIEREGFSKRYKSCFSILATSSKKDHLSPHALDKFGMVVLCDGTQKRHQVLTRKSFKRDFRKFERRIINSIDRARKILKKIHISDEIFEFVAKTSRDLGISSARADIFLLEAAVSYCAFLGEREVSKRHIYRVLPLVLSHRIKRTFEDEREKPKEKPKEKPEDKGESEEKEFLEEEKKDGGSGGNLSSRQRPKETKPKERIFEIGDPFPTKRFIFKRDRVERIKSFGRRTKAKVKGRLGRYVKFSKNRSYRDGKDIAIDATIRAASPFQKKRKESLTNKNGKLIILEDDLRYKKRERKVGHLFIFVCDGSGSMGVNERMEKAKAAIFSLLLDCYQKRDKVSMIVFRKDKAELVLPPTSSVTLCAKALRDIPTGGRTPLSAAILKAYEVAKFSQRKDRDLRISIIFITDGKGNVSLGDKDPISEMKIGASLFEDLPNVDIFVVDSEKKGIMSFGLAKKLAFYLKASYFTIDALKNPIFNEILKYN